MTIKISEDYSKMPGGRFRREGKYSGEDFRIKILHPKYVEAKRNGEELIVDLDGGYGYSTSFLEEAFGGLVRQTKDRGVASIIIVSDEEPMLIENIASYIEAAIKELHL